MSTPTMAGVTQTILASDPKRQGNCLAACVATFLDIDLRQVPHFIEFGIAWNGEEDRAAWWAMLCGFMAGHGLWLHKLASLAEADGGEVVFVAGPSLRGVTHQVLYRDGVLWHDPHPSRDGLLEVQYIDAWRPLPATGFDHVHYLPLGDSITHDRSEDCPCGPATRLQMSGRGDIWHIGHHRLAPTPATEGA